MRPSHSEAVSSTHDDFGAVESSCVNRQEIVDLVRQRRSVEMETESNSTIELDAENTEMTETKRTKKLFEHVKRVRPVTVSGKLPTLDDVRTVIAADFKNADEIWRHSATKKVTSRSVFYWHTAIYSLF